MSQERYMHHDFTYEGQAYRLAVYVDAHMGAPEDMHDGHGIAEKMSARFDPKDPGTYPYRADDDEEMRIRLSMYRPLARDDYMKELKWYDFLGTVIKAAAEGWGPPQAWQDANPQGTYEESVMAAVEADYAYLRGWYTDEWWWCVVSLIPLDAEGEEETNLAQYRGGVESTQSIEDMIAGYVPGMHAEVVDARERRATVAAKNAALVAVAASLLA